MPTDLTPAEKDDRQIERLIDKEPAPSRKRTERRGPKHDNRRRRMKDTSTEEKPDKDLSRKTQSSIFYIAARVAAKTEEELYEKKKDPSVVEDILSKDPGKGVEYAVNNFARKLNQYSSKLADSFKDYARTTYGPILRSKELKGKDADKSELTRITKVIKKISKIMDDMSRTPITGSPAEIAAQIAELWPKGEKTWATRAGIIAAVLNSINKVKAPASIRAVLMKDPGNVRKNSALLEEVLKEAKGGKITEESLADRTKLATLAAVYRTLLTNPDSIDASALVRDMDEITERVYGEMQKLLAVPAFMKSWEKAVKELGKEDTPETIAASEYYDEVQKSLRTFFKKGDDPVFDPNTFIEGLETVMGSEFEKASPELKKVVEGYRSAATSYDALRSKAMGQRTATYHGVLQQGDPTNGPYTGYRSLDRRYFGKEHYDSIIATAKALLKEDWLKYEWEGGAGDAPFRAAFDLSIWTADSNLYQAKIDVETYNMLLARLMGSKDDVFAETLITNDDSRTPRRASAMSNQHYRNILRVASDLRKSNPRAALDIVKNLRSLVAQQGEQGQEQGEEETPPPPPAAQGQQQQGQQDQQGQQQQGQECYGQEQQQGQQEQQSQQEQQGQQQQQGQISDKDTDAFVEGKVDIKDLKTKLKPVVDAKSIEDFVDGLMELDEVLKKTAAGRMASAGETLAMDLEPLEDMDEAQVKAFLEQMKAEGQKLLNEGDIESFMEGLQGIFGEAEDAAKSVKTGSVMLSMTALVRLAHSNPAARPVLLGILREAAKKKKKKKDKKDKKSKGKKPNPFADKGKGGKGDKGKGGKKPPFGGKKAPPFGGKKAPPFGKKKASVAIDPKDAEW